MIVTYLMILIYICALIYIGLKDHKTEDKDGFIIGDRKVGIIGTMSSMSASTRDGGGLTLWIGMGFAVGYGMYSLFLGFLIGTFLFSLLAPRAREIAKRNNYITIGQMVKNEIGVRTERFSSFIVLIIAVLVVSIQFYVLGNILSLLLGIDPFNSILISALVVAFYVSMGGYKSIVKTDILQFFIMLSLWAVVFFIPLKMDDVLNFSTSYSSDSIKDIIFFMLYIIIITFSLSDIWQRIFSAKNRKTAKYGVRLTSLALILMTLPLTFIGMSARGIIPADTANNDVVMAILQSGMYPSLIVSYLVIVGISVTMSTLDTQTYVFSSTILENFLKVSVVKNKKKYIYLSKIIMITMLVISAILSLSISNVVQYMFNAMSIMMVLSPLFIVVGAGWLKHKNKRLDTYFMWSLIASFVIGVYMFVQGYFTDFGMMLIPAVLSFLFMGISYFVSHLIYVKDK